MQVHKFVRVEFFQEDGVFLFHNVKSNYSNLTHNSRKYLLGVKFSLREIERIFPHWNTQFSALEKA